MEEGAVEEDGAGEGVDRGEEAVEGLGKETMDHGVHKSSDTPRGAVLARTVCVMT